MSKWRVERAGPDWLMDPEGRLAGYRDSRGREFLLAQAPGSVGDIDLRGRGISTCRPDTWTLRNAMRSAWVMRCAIRRASITPVANTATVRFVDTGAAFNGDGTAPYPATGAGLTGAFNAPPTLNTANMTVLFAENTTYVGALSVGANGIVLGTYEQTTGNRLWDQDRLATIDANGAQNAISRSGAFTGWAVSGLRVKNARHATQARGIYLVGDNCTAEFNVVEDVLPTGSPTTSCGIQASGANQTIRFNRIACTNCDLIQVSVNGSVMPFNPHVYCNDLRIIYADQDGPDCIQLYTDTSNSNTFGFKSLEICDNWLESEASNQKQGIIVQDIGAATSSGIVAGNVFWGCDIGRSPKLGTNNQKGLELQVPNVRVWRNFVRNADFGINVNNGGCDVRGNVVLQECTDGAAGAGYVGISMAGANGACEHNTVICTSDLVASRGIQTTSTFTGTNRRNLVAGTWAQGMRTNAAESDNWISVSGTPNVNGSGIPTAAGAGTTVGVDPLLTGVCEAALQAFPDGSPLTGMVDLLNRPWRGRTGAMQG